MTSEPQRRVERGPRSDPWRYRPEDRGARPWARQARGGQPGRGPDDGGGPVRDAEVVLATFGYLGAVFLGPVVPLGIYLIGRRMSPFTRHHVVMALNLSLTGLLYLVCCLILGGVLLLDSLTTTLVVTLPIAVVLWGATVRYLIRGSGAANRNERAAAPAWICARFAR
jgi:hypothetical protein